MGYKIKIFVFIVFVTFAVMIFLRPIKEYYYGLFPGKAAHQEKALIGKMSKSNPRVVELQQMLKKTNFYKGSVDGKIGKDTREAIVLFQIKNKIEPTGNLDIKTLSELKKQTFSSDKDSKDSVKKDSVPSTNAINFDVKNVQKMLSTAGFYSGRIDGKIGPKTIEAIKQFQKISNIKESGIIDIKTLDELKKIALRR